MNTSDRPIVPEIVDADESSVMSVEALEQLAHWMDTVFEIPALRIRFGLDSLLGLIPGVGDAVTTLSAFIILSAARRHGVSRVTMARMATNTAVDFVLGSLPVVGDLFDVYWKANQKNVALLKRSIAATPAAERRARRGDWLFIAGLLTGLLVLLAGAAYSAWSLLAWIFGEVTG